MNKKDLKEFFEKHWSEIEVEIGGMMIVGFQSFVGDGEICILSQVISKCVRQGIMRLIDEYEMMPLPLKEYMPRSKGKHLYILYDWRDEEVIYTTCSKARMYAKIGEMCVDDEYEEDMHIIAVNLEEVEK